MAKGKMTYTAHRKTPSWTVHRNGKTYTAHATKKKWKVTREDVGAKGKGEDVIGRVEKGKLSMFGYDTDKSDKARHKALRDAVEAYGATSVWRMLHAQVVFRKGATRGSRYENRKIFEEDRCWVEKEFGVGDQVC